jgi:hypothetical protein
MVVKKQFVQLVTLASLYPNDDDWLSTVSTVGNGVGYSVADSEDGGGPVLAEFAASEMNFADESIKVYDFIGSESEGERFYEKDCVVFENGGMYYVLDTPEIWEV